MSFSESMNQCLRTSLPVLLTSITFLSISLCGQSQTHPHNTNHWLNPRPGNATEGPIDYTKNDLILGFQDSFFWFLVPLFGLICVGVCIAINFVALGLTHVLAILHFLLWKAPLKSEDGRYGNLFAGLLIFTDMLRRTPAAFAVTSTRQRVITTGILLLLVSTVIPYQFAYLVLCIVQIITCTRAWRLTWETVRKKHFKPQRSLTDFS